MKTILILRHAKSSWKHPELSDHDRPLNKRGKREAPKVGEHLKTQGLQPDIILCSTAVRAQATAQAAAEACGYEGEIRYIPDLYHADIEDFVGIIQSLEEEFNIVMLVGHNPDLEVLLNFLIEEDESLPTAALAQVALPIGSWRELDPDKRGELVHFWSPREDA